MCFNAFDKAADLDVLDHPILNFLYYLVNLGLYLIWFFILDCFMRFTGGRTFMRVSSFDFMLCVSKD